MQVQSLVWELGAHTPQSRKPKCTSVQLSPLECQSRTNTRVQDVQKIPEWRTAKEICPHESHALKAMHKEAPKKTFWTRFNTGIKLYASTISWLGSFLPPIVTSVCVWLCLRVQGGDLWKSAAGIFVFLCRGYFWLSQCGGERLCYWHLVGKKHVI